MLVKTFNLGNFNFDQKRKSWSNIEYLKKTRNFIIFDFFFNEIKVQKTFFTIFCLDKCFSLWTKRRVNVRQKSKQKISSPILEEIFKYFFTG